MVPMQKEVKGSVHVFLACQKCGYETLVISETSTPLKVIEHSPQKQIAVIGKEQAKLRTMPTVKIECPKCGKLEAYWWMVQTRGADESPTQFFRCTRCGHTWREVA